MHIWPGTTLHRTAISQLSCTSSAVPSARPFSAWIPFVFHLLGANRPLLGSPGGEEEQDLLFTLRSSTVDRANAGHFVPMENPQQLGQSQLFLHSKSD